MHFEIWTGVLVRTVGVGEGGQGGHVPPKFGKKYSGNYRVKFGHFSANIIKNSAILIIFTGKYYVKLGILLIFPNFSYRVHIFSGKNV